MRRLAETRRTVALTLIYPALLLAIAWGLFAFSASTSAPAMYDAFHYFTCPASGSCKVSADRPFRMAVGPLFPTLLFLLAAVWWIVSKGCIRDGRPPCRGELRLDSVDAEDVQSFASCHFRQSVEAPRGDPRADGPSGRTGRRGVGRCSFEFGRRSLGCGHSPRRARPSRRAARPAAAFCAGSSPEGSRTPPCSPALRHAAEECHRRGQGAGRIGPRVVAGRCHLSRCWREIVAVYGSSCWNPITTSC